MALLFLRFADSQVRYSSVILNSFAAFIRMGCAGQGVFRYLR
jgi:hypothetical protein